MFETYRLAGLLYTNILNFKYKQITLHPSIHSFKNKRKNIHFQYEKVKAKDEEKDGEKDKEKDEERDKERDGRKR